MVPIMSLGVPIVVSAVIVFVASWIIHVILPIHRSDLRKLAKEDEVMGALRGLNIPPGDYMAPHSGSPEGMKRPEFIEKMKQGPVLIMTISPGTTPAMGKGLLLWFLYCLVVNFFAAYLTGRALGSGAPYLSVFRFVGTSAFLGYSVALAQDSIWYRRSWITTTKSMVDGLVYGLLAAGTFGWLWPR